MIFTVNILVLAVKIEKTFYVKISLKESFLPWHVYTKAKYIILQTKKWHNKADGEQVQVHHGPLVSRFCGFAPIFHISSLTICFLLNNHSNF